MPGDEVVVTPAEVVGTGDGTVLATGPPALSEGFAGTVEDDVEGADGTGAAVGGDATVVTGTDDVGVVGAVDGDDAVTGVVAGPPEPAEGRGNGAADFTAAP